jgi:hypothetical protein
MVWTFLFDLWQKWLQIWNRFFTSLERVLFKEEDEEPEEREDPLERFVRKQQERWCSGVGGSSSVEPCFYDKKVYDELTLTELKELSKRWHTRVMMVMSPVVGQTNILMYYDPEKLGFAYHSDFTVSSPRLLNALAMKYCLDFGCRDFFVDETVWKSPLLPLHALVDEKPVREPTEADDAFRRTLKEKSKLFVPKKEAAGSGPVSTINRKSNDPILVSNRFIYKNKVSDYSFLQKVDKEVVEKKEAVKELVFGIKPSLDCLFTDVMSHSIDGMFTDASVSPPSGPEVEPPKNSYKWFKMKRLFSSKK